MYTMYICYLLQIYKAPFAVVVDRKMNSVVVCVRGTLSIKVQYMYAYTCTCTCTCMFFICIHTVDIHVHVYTCNIAGKFHG